uniref:PID domain-containing protein n=1 Tax=Octopus bimaculoides TaxID=37653 RepID=A0A0L8GPY3_OCTBM
MPGSVAEWLQSLRLIDYCDTFISHGFDQMERVRQLWELELTTVLDIGTLGHRKRLLASLGEKQVPVPDVTKRHSSPFVSNLEESKPYFHDLNLFKDYSNLCSSTIQPEDLRKPSSVCATIGPVPCLSSQFNGRDADEIRREGKHIQDESVHIRPPHLAQSTSPVKQWCHKPEVLIKGCCNYIAQYLGSAVVWQLNGIDSTREGIAKMKKSTENMASVSSITLSISYKGVKFIDAESKRVVCEHEICNIFCACQDSENLNFFAYITKDKEFDKHYCHVFCVRSTDLARNIILTLGQAFEIAYQMALKEKAEEEALEFERKLSLGKSDYAAHSSSTSHTSQGFA